MMMCITGSRRNSIVRSCPRLDLPSKTRCRAPRIDWRLRPTAHGRCERYLQGRDPTPCGAWLRYINSSNHLCHIGKFQPRTARPRRAVIRVAKVGQEIGAVTPARKEFAIDRFWVEAGHR